jgi:hypothetical protein
VTNGPVYSITHGGGNTYIGGDFTHVGPRTGHGVSLDPTSGAWNPSAEVAGGQVRTVISDGAGGSYIGGDFTHVGGAERRGLARILSTGALDTNFRADIENTGATPASVRALLLQTDWNGQTWLYVGGAFTKIGVRNATNIGAVDPVTGATSTSFNPIASSDANGAPAGGTVHSLAGLNVELMVDRDGSQCTDATCPAPAERRAMSVIFVGGEFSHLGSGFATKSASAKLGAVWGVGSTRTNTTAAPGAQPAIASAGELVTTNGTATWSGASSLVRAITVPQPLRATGPDPADTLTVPVYVGGDNLFTGLKFALTQRHATAANVSRTAAGAAYSSWTPWTACATCSVRDLELADGNLYVGGEFTSIGQPAKTVSRMAALAPVADPTTNGNAAAAREWAPVADGMVRSLSVSGDNVHVAGDFATLTSGPAVSAMPQGRSGLGSIAKVGAANAGTVSDWQPNPTGGRVEPTTATSGGIANAIATGAAGEAVFAGGSFTSVGAASRSRLAAFDSSGQLTGWDPSVGCAAESCEVRTLDVAGGRVFAGGDFDSVKGQPRTNVAAIDAASGEPIKDWAPRPSWDVLALSAAGGKLYIGGAFSEVNGESRSRLAALDAASGSLLPWTAAADDHVRAVDASCDRVLVGGSFQTIGGAERSRIASLNTDTGVPTAWNPDAQGTVYDIERDGGTVYAAGQFALIGGALRQKIAALDARTGKATDWNPAADATVRAIALSRDRVFAGGIFREIGGENRSRIAAIDRATGDATPSFVAEADIDAVVYAADVSAGGAVFGGSFRRVNALAADSLFGSSRTEAEPSDDDCAPPPVVEQPVQQPVVEQQAERPPQPAQTPADPLPDVTAPKTTRFRVAPRAAPAGGKRRFLWTLSESVGYRIVIDRLVRTRRGKIRPKRVGALTGLASAGKAKRVWRGKLRKRVLRRGRYRARLIVVDPAGNRARSKRIPFRITKRATAERRSRRP